MSHVQLDLEGDKGGDGDEEGEPFACEEEEEEGLRIRLCALIVTFI
jgi:hypothetical protein